MFGLQRSFLLAGAKSVVVSLWPVPDRETCDLMREFYSLLLVGMPRAEALRRAQEMVRVRQPDPALWGGSILQGERRVSAASCCILETSRPFIAIAPARFTASRAQEVLCGWPPRCKG
jgi:hypothetical protein